MTSMLDRDRDDEPFFYANLRADGTGELLHSVNIGIPHVVGRALWAAAVAHETMATPVPEEPRRILERYLKSSFANEDHLNSYLDPNRGGQRYVEFHNMREGLYGIVASLMMGDAEWARETGDLMLATLASITGRTSVTASGPTGRTDRFAHGTPCSPNSRPVLKNSSTPPANPAIPTSSPPSSAGARTTWSDGTVRMRPADT